MRTTLVIFFVWFQAALVLTGCVPDKGPECYYLPAYLDWRMQRQSRDVGVESPYKPAIAFAPFSECTPQPSLLEESRKHSGTFRLLAQMEDPTDWMSSSREVAFSTDPNTAYAAYQFDQICDAAARQGFDLVIVASEFRAHTYVHGKLRIAAASCEGGVIDVRKRRVKAVLRVSYGEQSRDIETLSNANGIDYASENGVAGEFARRTFNCIDKVASGVKFEIHDTFPKSK